jgi:hypothetical protein
MSSLEDRIAPADPANPYLRVTLYTALSLLCKGAELLSRLPDVTTAFETGDLERFRLLSAADASLGWLVGSGTGDSVDSLGRDSALGDAAAALDWTDQEADEHFTAGLADWKGVS